MNIKETIIKKVIPVIENKITPSNISVKEISFKDSINTLLKSSMNIFNDLILPVNKRIGFLGGDCSLYTSIFL